MNLRRGKSLYNSTKKGYLPPKKLCKVSQSTGKRWLLLSFWTLIDYNEKGVNFMAIYYLVLFEKLKNTIKQKRKKLEVCVFRKAMHPSIRVMLRWWSYKHLAILLNIQDLSVWYLFLKIRWGWLFLPSTHFFLSSTLRHFLASLHSSKRLQRECNSHQPSASCFCGDGRDTTSSAWSLLGAFIYLLDRVHTYKHT